MSSNEAAIESEIQAKGLNAQRLTPAHIDEQIECEYYINAMNACEKAEHPVDIRLKVLTICILVLKNGYIVTGESACASPENYDAEIGRKIARDNARNKIWALEGYLLRSHLANVAIVAPGHFGE